MRSWTDQRILDFEACYAEWPENITIGNLSLRCIKEPDSKMMPMGQQGWENTIQSKFSALTSEFIAVNLMPTDANHRPRFTRNNVTWQIFRVGDDSDVDPIIDFWASRTQ